jgi:hypothetical protein
MISSLLIEEAGYDSSAFLHVLVPFFVSDNQPKGAWTSMFVSGIL